MCTKIENQNSLKKITFSARYFAFIFRRSKTSYQSLVSIIQVVDKILVIINVYLVKHILQTSLSESRALDILDSAELASQPLPQLQTQWLLFVLGCKIIMIIRID